MRFLRYLILVGMVCSFFGSSVAHAVLLEGTMCQNTENCVYDDERLKTGIGSLTFVPRFYHMAQQCYLQGAMMETIKYYNNAEQKAWTSATTGVLSEWQLDSFCTHPLKDDERVLNQHVLDNMNHLRSALPAALKQFDARFSEGSEKALLSLDMRTPEKLVSDILWLEYIEYMRYRSGINRQPDDYRRALTWANSDALSRSGGSAVWTTFLTEQIDLVSRLKDVTDGQIATATRYLADIMYAEFLRTYLEHLEYLKMRTSLQGIAQHLDRMERALANLGVKLPDAFIIGN